jgi:peptidoglycan/xylan/chitin deacetylase (PgdA/CDA1 family)
MLVSRGNPDRPLVALTFDTGSDAGYTTQILQTLRDEKIKASFAVTGQWARRYPELLQAIAADGHLLMNHSQDHPSFTGFSTGTGPLSREERISQLQQAEEAIRALTGVSTKPYFRPPYGDVDGSVLCDAYAAGYGYVVMWSVDTAGWNHATAQQILQTVLAGARPGAIYIMHVGSESADGLALPQVIQGLRAKGYQFGTVADLLP